jgi:hypothetical protein
VAGKRWSELTPGTRRTIVVVGMFDAAMRAAMLIDLRHRSPEEVKGSKRLWGWSALANSAGVIPLAYFVVGRERPART